MTPIRGQFNSDFRNLVKSEVAKFAADDRLEVTKADGSTANKLAKMVEPMKHKPGDERLPNQQKNPAAKDHPQMARYAKLRDRVQPEHVVETQQKRQQTRLTEFVEKLATSAYSTNLSAPRQLTISDMRDYAERTYRGSGNVDLVTIASE